LELATVDRKHIEKFKNHTQSDAKIHDVIRKPSKLLLLNNVVKNEYYSSNFIINSKKMCYDLSLYNIVPKKTYIYEMPDWLINHNLIHHFIRGYIDGDGSFSFNKRNDEIVSVKLSLIGASKVVFQIFNILNNKCNTRFGGFSEKSHKRFWFNSLIDLEKIIDFLYKDATIFLERKYNKAKEIKQLIEKSTLYNFDPQELQRLYNELGSFNAVAKIFKCDRTTIRYQMHNLGLNYRNNPEMSRK
jgi:hypothetical protein